MKGAGLIVGGLATIGVGVVALAISRAKKQKDITRAVDAVKAALQPSSEGLKILMSQLPALKAAADDVAKRTEAATLSAVPEVATGLSQERASVCSMLRRQASGAPPGALAQQLSRLGC